MFQSNHKQNINTILFNILEEFSLFDVFAFEDIGMINNIAMEKYKRLFEITKDATNKYLTENLNKNKNKFDNNEGDENDCEETGNYYENRLIKSEEKLIISDINECKSSILAMVNTYYLHFLCNKKMSIAENLFKVNLNLIKINKK